MVAQPSCVIEEVEDWHDATEVDPPQQAQQDEAADSSASTTSDNQPNNSAETAAAVRQPLDDEDDAFVDSQETAEAPLSEEERQVLADRGCACASTTVSTLLQVFGVLQWL